jgi:hypothetical protein
MASSFSKRRYTPGHFSNSIAKVNTDVKKDKPAAVSLPVAENGAIVSPNTPIAKNEKNIVKPNFAISATKPVNRNEKPVYAVSNTFKKGITGLAKAVSANAEHNLTTYQPAPIETVAAYGDHNGGGGGEGHHYLRKCFLCLLLWVIFGLLWLITFGPILGFLAWLFFVLAVVFLILWVVTV